MKHYSAVTHLLPVTAALLTLWSAPPLAQAPSTSDAAALPRFEAASIRPKESGAIDLHFLPSRFVATTVTASQLIEQAYRIEPRELVGGPDWVRVERFDVTATAGEEVPPDRMRLMLRSLLADRFQLELEREERTGTVYRLIARDVRNLNSPAKADDRPLVSTIRNDANGFLSYEYRGRNASIAQLVLSLAGQLRAPVIDETKLAGNYDFQVPWTYDQAFGGLQPDPNIPTIFTALDNQLGLKLVADRGPVPVHVIRRISKPSAN
jgi:uncharacterized protein (TIGR03435 family)